MELRPDKADVFDSIHPLLHRLIGRITRYEARMRADGLLAEGRYVTSVDAWDLGRAPNTARWASPPAMAPCRRPSSGPLRERRRHPVLPAPGRTSPPRTPSAAASTFDDEECGRWYEEMVSAHHILTQDPGSLWLNIPFK
ncbi:hypothetical protein [Streptomyces sp. NPDC046939]|uniref:hypothetical protein n=1 Tax=Streptomyces sp. NPDC046939 TaxID=3155376 RepID=UPI0033D3262A